MQELRKVQRVAHNTLSVSIPRKFAKDLGLKKGDSLLFKEDVDGTLRLIPSSGVVETSRATIRADQAGSEEMLARLIVGSYALGYDTIEVVGKNVLSKAVADKVVQTVKRLRGLEVVESDERRVIAQSFTDPTKFPVDSLIKRLQVLVSRNLENVTEALGPRTTWDLAEVRRVQDEIDELYWLIVRQLLIALNRRELASDIGIESPLHASGDRVSAKTLDEMGGIILEIAEELDRLRQKGTKTDPKVAAGLKRLAQKAGEAFDTTMESLLTPDIRLTARSVVLVDETLRLEKEIARDVLDTGDYGYARVLASFFGQLARYCNIIIEIASHRLLRKTSKLATVQ